MSNKKLGNNFEAELCEILFDKGFWAHNMTQNASGQPADVIAVRQGLAYLIDCKVCSNCELPFSRIEENQKLAMKLWQDSGNGSGWFAALVGEEQGVYMIPYYTIKGLMEHQSSMRDTDFRKYGISLERWLREA